MKKTCRSYSLKVVLLQYYGQVQREKSWQLWLWSTTSTATLAPQLENKHKVTQDKKVLSHGNSFLLPTACNNTSSNSPQPSLLRLPFATGAGKLQHCTWSGLNFSLIMQVISKEVTCDSYSEVTRDTYLILAGGSWGSASPIWSKHESIWILQLGNLGEVVGWRWVGQHITKFYYVNGVGMIPGFLRCAAQDCKHVQQQQPIQQLRSILSQRYIFLRRMTMFNKLNFSLCGKNNLPR